MLAFTFLNSLGTGVVTNGIYFISKHGFGFGRTENLLLGVLLGVTYIVGSLVTQPLIHRLQRTFPALTERVLLQALMVIMTALCLMPILAVGPEKPDPEVARRFSWTLWVMVLCYSPLTGMLWPITESYMSGGRSGANLRRAMGVWNVCWSSALILAYWAISPFVESNPGLVIALLGACHLLALLSLRRFSARPPAHDDDLHEPHPDSYPRLLRVFRLLLPMSYVIMSVIGPLLPNTLARLVGVPELHAILASAWLLPRCATFLLLAHWSGWRGRWLAPILGGAFLFAGFVLILGGSALSPAGAAAQGAVSSWTALAIVLTGLLALGLGMGTIYTGALYYAMSVGKAEVSAGGKHESLIGVGYTAGPLVGLSASLGVQAGVIGESSFDLVTALGVLGLCALGAVLFWNFSARSA